MNDCCKTTFLWNGTPTGKEQKIGDLDTYVAGDKKDRAILICHDALGWKLNNTRLLADHFAKEVGATVYLPDFFHGSSIDPKDVEMVKVGETYEMKRNMDFDWETWFKNNWVDVRMPEILECLRHIREKHPWVASVGYCWGGAANFKLASKGVLDCVTIAHPGNPTEEEVKAINIPVQILAPEHDPTFTQQMKDFCKLEIPKQGVDFIYHHFPDMVHGFATKCDENNPKEKKALEMAKNAVVYWFLNHAP